jgi:hypothetical protein
MAIQFLPKIKESFVDFEKQKENKNVKPQWKTIEQPWKGFSEQISEEYKKLKVSHRAYNKRIVGHLHKDTIYGPAVIYERHKKDDEKKGIKKGDVKIGKDGNPILKEGMYIKSIPAIGIKQNHLRMPDGWDKLKEEYKNAPTNLQRKTVREKMLALEDVPPGKSGIVRDIELRDKILDWLKEHNFSDMVKAKAYIKENGLIINGTPVRKVRMLWKLNEVVEINRKGFDYKNSPLEKQRKSLRVYQTQNNHHIEIRENKKGKWIGEVITNFDAAKRNIERLKALKDAGIPSSQKMRELKKNDPIRYREMQERYGQVISKINQDYGIVNRSDTNKGRFVMSLAKGEVVHIPHPETKEDNYFVVFKIDSTKSIHFTPHTDANPAISTKYGQKIREDIPLVPDNLRQHIIFNENGVPEKVRISPLGEIKVLIND